MRTILAVLALLVGSLAPSVARAQADFYNLDDDRPTLIEDAYPTGYGGLEFQLALARAEWRKPNQNAALFVTEMNYGAWYNLQVGVAGRAFAGNAGRTVTGFSDTTGFALYNVNRESRWLPALAIRADIGFPTGSLSNDANRYLGKLILTRSFGRLRAHANAAAGFGGEPKGVFATDVSADYLGGLALDYPVTFNFLVLGEGYAMRLAGEDENEIRGTLGFRWQATPRWVVDAGAGTGSTGGETPQDVSAILGFTFTPGAVGL